MFSQVFSDASLLSHEFLPRPADAVAECICRMPAKDMHNIQVLN